MNVTEIKFTNFSSTEREELKKQLRQELAEEIIDSKRCKNCKFFRQHYAKATLETPWAKDDFFKVDGGHCTAVRIKNRKARYTGLCLVRIQSGYAGWLLIGKTVRWR